jgi:hypothetical protein
VDQDCCTKEGLIHVCDPCWEVLTSWLMIVPSLGLGGDRPLREMRGVLQPQGDGGGQAGGRYNAYSGTCGSCAQESGREYVGAAIQGKHEGEA